jgi:hypothetical protein
MYKYHVTSKLICSSIFVIGLISPAQAGSTKLVSPEPVLSSTIAGGASSSPSIAALLFASGDIEAYLKTADYGTENDGIWTMPSPFETSAFATALGNLIAGDLAQAAQDAGSIGFQLIEYTDPARGLFYILRDTPDGSKISRGGTYVWNPQASYRSVIEVPHPNSDSRTDEQGIELFLASRSSLLLLSGTHRRSDSVLSQCSYSSANDYRRSDPAHAEEHLFHVAHVVAENSLIEPLFIQLHGFGSSGYTELKKQCKHRTPKKDPELLVNVSDTFKDRSGDGSGAPPPGSFARTLTETINAEGTIKACLYNEDTESYGGTLNVQARYTNHSVDPCHAYAETNDGRFIHLEQSYNTRRYQRPLMTSLIIAALQAYFGP